MLVAAVSSVPVLVLPRTLGRETVGDAPAVLVGVVGYALARHAKASRWASLFYGVTALALAVLVALVKTILSAH
jgi:hypothetical protein